MSDTLAILPVKCFGSAKQRLAPALEARERRELAGAMLSDVLAGLRHVPELDLVVVSADPAIAGADVHVLADTEQAGQSAAVLIGIRHALRHGYGCVLLVPGDAPLLDPGELGALLARPEPVCIVPDRHGTGTNALLLAPPDAISPSFGPCSRARHAAAAEAAGAAQAVVELPGLALDVDTGDDVAALAAELRARPEAAPATRAVLRRLQPDRPRAVPVAWPLRPA